MGLSYAVITPARDEAENLPALARCLADQRPRPALWMVVDNGSSDDTAEIVSALAREHSWVRLATAPGHETVLRGGPVVRAFHVGVAALERPYDVIVKLDADVTFEPDYFERMLGAFEADPALGMASGTCYDSVDGVWRERYVTGGHVWGAARGYRWACLRQLLPLEERMGWDGIDGLKAVTRGWKTRTLRELPFFHHRPEAGRDPSSRGAWAAQGEAAYFMGYRFSYLFLRTLYRALRERAALMILWGYLAAAWRREPRFDDEPVRAYLRREQSMARLPARIREALGRGG